MEIIIAITYLMSVLISLYFLIFKQKIKDIPHVIFFGFLGLPYLINLIFYAVFFSIYIITKCFN